MRIADRLAKLEARANERKVTRDEEAAHADALSVHMSALADKLPPDEAAETLAFRDTLLRSGNPILIRAFRHCIYGDWQA